MKVKLKKFKYVLDWFEITEVEIDTDRFTHFVLQFRCGSWYLMHFANVGGNLKNVYEHDFELSQPWEAVTILGDKIKRYESLHSAGVTKPLAVLMAQSAAA